MIRQSLTTGKDYIWYYRSMMDEHQYQYGLSTEQLVMVYEPTKYGSNYTKTTYGPILKSCNSYIDLFFVCVSNESASNENLEQFLKGIDIHTAARIASISNWIDNKYMMNNAALTNLIFIINLLINHMSRQFGDLVVQSSKLNATWELK